MRLEIDSDNIPHLIPETYDEEDILFDWYEKNSNLEIFKNVSLEWCDNKNKKVRIKF